MPADPDIEEGQSADEWHRKTAARLFNGAWDLIEKNDRSGDDEVEMLLRAFASRWHWGQVGGSLQVSSGDWQIAHVASLMGLDQLALLFASRCLEAVEGDGSAGWRLASAHEGMARAYACAGDCEAHATCASQRRRSPPSPKKRSARSSPASWGLFPSSDQRCAERLIVPRRDWETRAVWIRSSPRCSTH
jgi:hypothetical protein